MANGEGVRGEVVAAVDSGDGDGERVEGDDDAVAFAIGHRDEQSPAQAKAEETWALGNVEWMP